MFERYTEQARRVIFFARYEASQYGAPEIDTAHLLLALAREDGPLLSRLLDADEPLDEVRKSLEGLSEMKQGGPVKVDLPLGREAKAALHYAMEESGPPAAAPIGTEHLLLGLLRVEGTPAEQVLRGGGLTVAGVREFLGRAPGETFAPEGGAAQAVGGGAAASKEPAAADAPTTMKIEHIGIATPRLDDALLFWRDALGLEVVHTEVIEEQGVRVAMLPAGEPSIELVEPTGENSPVAKFLEKRGPGIHHIAVRVPDIRAALARLKDRGARLIDAEPRVGAGGCLVAFIHPRSAGGVLLELVEHARAPHQ